MKRFTQHIPSFIGTGSKRIEILFETLEKLWTNEYFRRWNKEFDGRRFVGYRLSGRCLIADYEPKEEETNFCWVLGYISEVL